MQRIVDNSVFRSSMGNPAWEHILPELMSRLLSRGAIEDIESLRIMCGENYKRQGLDGKVTLNQKFGPIPAGQLIFEFGSEADTRDFKKKAESEFVRTSKLKTSYDDLVLVVVGRALWDDVTVTKKDKENKILQKVFWAEEKLQTPKQPFKAIVVIDQELLIGLLSNDLPTSIWLYEELGLAFSSTFGVRSTRERINIFQSCYIIDVSPALLVDGQEWALRAVEDLLGDKKQPLTIYGNTSTEASVAVTHLVLTDKRFANIPAICVSSEIGLKLLEGVTQSHIVILEDEATSQSALALSNHQLVVCKAISRQVVQGQPLVISRPTVEVFSKHIGTLEDDLNNEKIARACGRTLTALERRYPAGFEKSAPWDDPDLPEAALIRMLAAVGGWNSTKVFDREINDRNYQFKDVGLLLSFAAEKEYKKLADIVKRYGRDSDRKSGASDPLFAMSANVVAVNAPLDALFRLAGQMSDDDFDELERMLVTVLSSRAEVPPRPDDVYDPTKEQGYSENLVGGLILTFVLIGVFGAREPLNIKIHGQSSDVWCARVYRDVVPALAKYPAFSNAIREWQSLLAEGMPHAFLESLEVLLKGDNNTVQEIFQTQENCWGLGRTHLGVAILWALERLAWREDLVEKVCDTLFELHIMGRPFDDGIGNTPINSLKGVLYPGLAQTSVDAQKRIRIFSSLAERYGSDALDLFVPLIDTRGGYVTSTSKPLFTQVTTAEDTWQDVYDSRDHLSRLSISCARRSAEALSKLIDPSAAYKLEIFDELIYAIQDIEVDDEGFAMLREEIRDFVGRHKQFPDANWSADDDRTDRLEQEVRRLTPKDSRRFLWLFEKPYVNLHDSDYNNQEKKLEAFRCDAASSVLCEGPREALEFILTCKSPGVAARAIGQAAIYTSDILHLCQIISEPGPVGYGADNESLVLRGLSGGALENFSQKWLDRFIGDRNDLSDLKLRRMGGGLYPQGKMVNVLCDPSLPEPLRIGFWSEVNIYAFFHHELPQQGINELFNAGRAHEMAALISKKDKILPDKQVIEVATSFIDHLSKAFADGRGHDALGMHNFWKMLDVLEDRNLMPVKEIAKLEFPFARMFRFEGPKRPLAIHRVLASEPEEVLALAKVQFKSDVAIDNVKNKEKDSIDNTTNNKESVTAANREAIYHVLDTFNIIPGRDENIIDESVLAKWVEDMKTVFAKAGYSNAYSDVVGQLLSHSPDDPDDHIWPHKVIRNILETHSDERMISALMMAEFNERGVIVGSSEENHLQSADKFKSWADQLTEFPKTQAMLRQIVQRDRSYSDWDRQRQLDEDVSPGLR